ncbi:RNA 2',3'-cyclic phosphodiesterase [Candidatus Bathyarchaeota archaeon]|nr:MAG: RNA 2',3'-cyclic phosphodiesterase [Candidatus Bathyarchaeota archaeon]
MSETVRSFIAFDINDDEVLSKITDLQKFLIETGADLKLVEPKNIHITVRFLGNIRLGMVEKIYEVMKNVAFKPFNVRIHGIGAFPKLRYPRVLWAGITDGADKLRNIFNQLEPSLRGLGFAPDTRGFSPHLTIARVKSGRNKMKLIDCISKYVDFNFGIVRAECLRLKKSQLTPKGPIYSTLKEFCPQA